MYPSKGSQTPYNVHALTPYSEHLIIDYSKKDIENMIRKETSTDKANPDISSVYFYEVEYLVKTCYGLKKYCKNNTSKRYRINEWKFILNIFVGWYRHIK